MMWGHLIFAQSAMTPLRPIVALVCLGLRTSSFTLGEVTPTCGLGRCVTCTRWLEDVAFALAYVEQGKRDKHARTCRSHGFDFISFGFSSRSSFGPEAEELLSRICLRYSSHVQVPPWEALVCRYARSGRAPR